MTKTEFRSAAEKAGINPDLYGAILSANLRCLDSYGPISGGKVIGIVWKNDWKSEKRYNYMMGSYTETFLSPTPYVVLKKNRKTYHVSVAEINTHLNGLFRSWLKERIQSGEPL